MKTRTELNDIVLTPEDKKLLKQFKSGKSIKLSKSEASNLTKLGLIQPENAGFAHDGFPVLTGAYTLSSDGIRYRQVIFQKRRDYIKYSILTPIFVSIITSVLTTELTPFIKSLLLQFLQRFLQ